MDAWREPNEEQKKIRRRSETSLPYNDVAAPIESQTQTGLKTWVLLVTTLLTSLVTASVVAAFVGSRFGSDISSLTAKESTIESEVKSLDAEVSALRTEVQDLGNRLKKVGSRTVTTQPQSSASTIEDVPQSSEKGSVMRRPSRPAARE